MQFRGNPLPRHLPEILLFLTVAILVPLGFLYEIFIVVPAIHEPGGFLHAFTILIATFLLLNIEGNLIASMIIDTSVKFEKVVAPENESKDFLDWRHCKKCDQLAPPRSWHCKLCGVCILKRDHHCAFTGYCVGHHNQRYFICFVLYTVIGSVYALIYNSYYMWILHGPIFGKFYLNVLFSRLFDVWAHSTFWTYLQSTVYGLNILLLFISSAIFIIYMPCMWRGELYFEKKKHPEYNHGVFRNLINVFGQRMHVAWIFPSVASPLPEDGYTWRKTINLEVNHTD